LKRLQQAVELFNQKQNSDLKSELNIIKEFREPIE
jgi:hypothetical protein